MIDADNTLWDTDGVFAEAQLGLLDAVEHAANLTGPKADRLEFVRTFDQELAQRHHLGLRYPPRLLIDALTLGLRGVDFQEAVRRAWSNGPDSGLDRAVVAKVESDFFVNIAKQPKLLAGVVKGLRDLNSIGATAVVFTEGSRKRVIRTIESHQLGEFIDRVFEAPKTVRMFERVKKLARKGQSIYVIGDQLTRDIRPANEAGVRTIYIPGGFQPKWELEAGSLPTFQARSFDAAIFFLLHSEDDPRPATRQVEDRDYSLIQNRT
ncbi:HAD family hydrolase [Rhizobium sp. NLR9b]|uniref:HAD family hydrolase n=1 Tax=unclassified Rhizobium TaxID=2613769 RepID=UPI001C82847C|nr:MULTISPECIES: HAD family hydrolase [unclassified Rhizobium]MBX5227517.1 HAD family hydrolase [Rhizobium sp. NLR9b]MBX5288561.1 HAD family hydrolase [Rhizobium sp. NLR10b]